ncbi:MAG: ABC transporter permease [Ignavibacterium sp.]|nr:MAG: ABC transporter permease [Ignavibacterium sp.]
MNKVFIKSLSKRIVTSIITLFLLVSFLFVLTRLSPGDPTQKYLSAEFSPELKEKVTASFKLDQPIFNQYINFVANIFKGNFGISYGYRQPVLSVVWQFLSFTLVFATLSFLLQIIVSSFLAFKSIRNKGKLFDRSVLNISLIVYAIPAFVLGLSLIYIFSIQLDLFPSSGLRSLDFESNSFFGKIGDYIYHLSLPLITLSLAGIALFYKYLRESLEDVYQQNFILNLKASGYDQSTILKKHVLPNAVRPLLSIAGIELGILLGGALITEVIFSLPGMGRLMMDSIFARDYPLVIGCALTAGVLMIASNFLADMIKMKLDKRLIKGLIN